MQSYDVPGHRSPRPEGETSSDPAAAELAALGRESLERLGRVEAALHTHEQHHATDLHRFVEATRCTLGELAAGVGGGEDLSWAVRGVREIHAHLRRLDERSERLQLRADADGHPDASAPDGPGAGRVGGLFDYAGFERQFRGSSEEIQRTQVERYSDLLASAPGRVVDVGCGRGEFLRHLMDSGVQVVGIEPDAGMAAVAQAHGVPVQRTTAGEYLRTVPDRSLGAVVSFQVVEHLAFGDVLELVDLAARKLVPGGLFVAETPNPASWIVMHSSFILDPTHRWPLHPALLAFSCTSAGLEQVEVRYYAEATSLQLPAVSSSLDPGLADQVNRAFAQLNHHLYGPQDYSVVAWTPNPGGAPAGEAASA
jgi:predicted TPR repeat methyltransferase